MRDYFKKNITRSGQETERLGKKVAGSLFGPAVFGLVGDLGAGKTQFVKGLALGLGIKAHITSPTFVLLKIYKIKNHQSAIINLQSSICNLVHIDCYRLADSSELLDLGFKEFLQNKNSLIVVEWADKIKSILPKDTIWIKFNHGKKPEERVIVFQNQDII
ncbi:tRNA (adenosine(37)-N6)-threonylcarbamoyltransferase complex ATPase subunit type 1 TsaE [Candidatus Kuenenbacteria bacterium RIFCSPHIGHO2_12_FULL_42_14]|uniref:tRNA threonylcarbamoyladenosine biosynthesis protein TsaE n=1 Tax=Candidatus Kuenenbacteria bacterium RIFCSPHIGHO2_12_FULL_42_14 TaxID=1798563 RepID=A0A1F6GKI4_9BACT|nr:MAG: tRNA (adenosine(37)-N6)-threonylcarbamoyltransferase complex ATPase subunit type 1 TsaE [Candidatus Kuenenbacteria bacterium RIFCSPHIGHO2_12_FULL_42_14]